MESGSRSRERRLWAGALGRTGTERMEVPMDFGVWVRAGAYLLLSAALLAGFLGEMRRGPAHAVPRFVAFEAILGLVLVNAPTWFEDPGGVRQLVSWSLLGGSLVLALHGFWELRTHGGPTGGLETTTLIVRRGAYRYIRHPLYLSLILFALGAYLKSPAWLSTCLLGVAVGSLWVTSRVEERENLSRFGESYRDYMHSTKGFVPFLL